jgi:virginiamycin B lyase
MTFSTYARPARPASKTSSTNVQRIAVCLVALALSACGGGGGGGGSSSSPGGGAPVVPVPANGTAQLAIIVPSVGSTGVTSDTPSSTRGIKPFYVSAGSNLIGILINGTPVDPSTVAQTCNPNQSGATVCTFNFPAPAGNDGFDIKLADANANVLSEGTVQATITGGQTTVLHLTFLGQPARVALQLDNPYPLRGTTSTLKLTATAFDDANYQIIGDNYLHPIVITSNDSSGKTSLSGTQFNNPNDSIAVTYNGKRLANATFSVSSPSSTANSAAVLTPNAYAQFGPTAYTTWQVTRGADGNVWFVECAGLSPCKIGKITPAGQITESADVQYAKDLTAGPDGNIWFTENNRAYIGQITPSMQIHEFLIRNLLPNEGFYAGPIVAGADGNLWFGEGDRLAAMNTSGQVVREIMLGGWYLPADIELGPDGAYWVSEFQRIASVTTSGSVTQRDLPNSPSGAMVFGQNQLLYYSYANSVQTMSLSGSVSQVTLTPSGGTFQSPFVIDANGNLWGSGSIPNIGHGVTMMTPGGALTVDPMAPNLVGGSNTTINAMTWGADGNLWIAGVGGNYITRYYNGP